MTQGPPDFPQASPSENLFFWFREISQLLWIDFPIPPSFWWSTYIEYNHALISSAVHTVHILSCMCLSCNLPTNPYQPTTLQLLILATQAATLYVRVVKIELLGWMSEADCYSGGGQAANPNQQQPTCVTWLSTQPSLTCCCWCNAHRGAERFKNLPKKWTEGRNFKEPRKCHHIIKTMMCNLNYFAAKKVFCLSFPPTCFVFKNEKGLFICERCPLVY